MKTSFGKHGGSPLRMAGVQLLLAAALLLPASSARAADPGVAGLEGRVAQAAREHPRAFQAVAAVKRNVPAMDQRRRGPIAAIAPVLKAQKKDALWPLVGEVLSGMSSPDFLPSARAAWAVGVLEALGALGDPQASPAVLQALRTETEPRALRAAAAALGQVDPEAADVLLPIATHAGPRQLPVISGLAECRTSKAARGLAGLLAGTGGDDPVAVAAAKALGELASSWVWQRPAYAARPERDEVRSIAARALVTAFLRTTGQARTMAERQLLVVDWDGTAGLIEKARAERPEQAAELDRLAARLASNPLRGQVR